SELAVVPVEDRLRQIVLASFAAAYHAVRGAAIPRLAARHESGERIHGGQGWPARVVGRTTGQIAHISLKVDDEAAAAQGRHLAAAEHLLSAAIEIHDHTAAGVDQ